MDEYEDGTLSLKSAAERIIAGEGAGGVIKDVTAEWNRLRKDALSTNLAAFFMEEPSLTGRPAVDAWLAGAAECQAFLIGEKAPLWVTHSCRFLADPTFCSGSPEEKKKALMETPSFFRKRLLFCGKSKLR